MPDSLFPSRLAEMAVLTEDERTALARLPVRARSHPAERPLIGMGDRTPNVLLLQAGWAILYWLLPDGRRQIFDFVIPGDFVDLRAAVFGFKDRAAMAITPVSTVEIRWSDVLGLVAEQPRLAGLLLWECARQETRVQRHLLDVGQRDSRERMAHILVELYERLDACGATQSGSFAMPVTQEMLGDALGLSFVHVNRTLRRLREDGLVKRRGRRYLFPDIAALKHIAGYDDGLAPERQAFEGRRLDGLFSTLLSSRLPARTDKAG